MGRAFFRACEEPVRPSSVSHCVWSPNCCWILCGLKHVLLQTWLQADTDHPDEDVAGAAIFCWSLHLVSQPLLDSVSSLKHVLLRTWPRVLCVMQNLLAGTVNATCV